MNKSQVKGHANEAKGKAKEVAGKATGDKSTEYKGYPVCREFGLIGVEFGVLAGLVLGLLNIVPFLGTLIGMLVVLAMVESGLTVVD